MHSVWFGEFLGRWFGVAGQRCLCRCHVAQVLRGRRGWMVIATGWALAVLCGVLVAQAFGSPGANLNPAITLAVAVINGNYSQLASLCRRNYLELCAARR